jgi:RND family efflux transporter MFP subunit
MRRSWLTALLALTVGVSATGFYIVRKKEKRTTSGELRIVHAERRVLNTTVNATGTVRLRVGSEVRVGSQLSGIVKKLNVTVGSHVQSGAVIAEIDDAPIQARLAQAEAQGQLDRASLERAAVDSDRAQKLVAQQLIPVQQAQDRQLALAEAKARWEKSLRDRDFVRVDLSYVDIRAPISGTVASVSTQEGETVAASFTAPTFVTIIRDNALQLIAMVDETDIANVRRGNRVVFTVDAYPSRDFAGTVESVAPKATIVSGVVNYEVSIAINRDAELLKPDMTANVTIRTAQHEAVILPGDAVQHDGEQSFVYLVARAGREQRTVVVGMKEGDGIEIKKGVSPGDEVLVTTADSATPDARKNP